MVLANPEIANLPGWVIGIVAAGALAAALSTAAGLLLAISSAVSHDLYANVFKRGQVDEQAEMRFSKMAVIALGIVAIFLPTPPFAFSSSAA